SAPTAPITAASITSVLRSRTSTRQRPISSARRASGSKRRRSSVWKWRLAALATSRWKGAAPVGGGSTFPTPDGRRSPVDRKDEAMADDFTICVGTVGTGAWLSPDGGESWRQVRSGLWSESRIFGFAAHPKQPRTILAGADAGVYRGEEGGEHFERLDSPMNTLHVWKVAYDPSDPNTIFAGTRPAALFRSTDGGQHWETLRADMAEECPNVRV